MVGTVGNMKALFAQATLYSSSRILPQAVAKSPSRPWQSRWAARLKLSVCCIPGEDSLRFRWLETEQPATAVFNRHAEVSLPSFTTSQRNQQQQQRKDFHAFLIACSDWRCKRTNAAPARLVIGATRRLETSILLRAPKFSRLWGRGVGCETSRHPTESRRHRCVRSPEPWSVAATQPGRETATQPVVLSYPGTLPSRVCTPSEA